MPGLCRLLEPVKGLLLFAGLFQILGVGILNGGIAHLGPGFVDIRSLLRLGKDDVLVPLGVEVVQVVGGKVDAAPVGLLEPTLAFLDVFFQVGLVGARVGEGILALALNPQEVPPEVGVADCILAEGVSRLRLLEHDIKCLLNAGKGHLLFHRGGQLAHPHGNQHAQRAALRHGLVHELNGKVIVLGKAVAAPYVLGAAVAPAQNAGSVPVSGGRGLFQQSEALFPLSGPQIVVNVPERLLHFIAETYSHFHISPYSLYP